MILRRRDFFHLRASLALFAALSFIGGGVIFATLRAAAAAERTYQTALAQDRDAEARFARAGAETAAIDRKLILYRELLAREDGGKEYRAVWLQRIAEAQTRHGIALRYELSPRRPLQAASLPGRDAMGGHEFTASAMKLQMQLPHEQALLDFLDDAARDVHAFLQVRSCDVGRRDGGLDAECVVDWITLRERP